MMQIVNPSNLVFFTCISIVSTEFNPLADNILFNLKWTGPDHDSGLQQIPVPDENTMLMTTKNNEKYRCVLPSAINGISQAEQIEAYSGPSEFELLAPLFKQTTCSYRLESYWTYELCHGKYLRQYHEDKELGKKAKMQEYILGKYTADKKTDVSNKEVDKEVKEDKPKEKIPILKIEGIELPYYEVHFDDGTLCDLIGRPRQAHIRYVCQPDGKGEIYAFKEVSTCEYALVVLTSTLCTHPAYEVRKEPVNEIKCHSLDGSPRRPVSLDNLEMENSQGQYNRRQSSVLPKKQERTIHERVVVDKKVDTQISTSTDQQLLNEFLRGEHCIKGGGSGWWQHEFCYGKSVIQFHEEKHGKRTDIILGIWDEEDHVRWLEKNPGKKPKSKEIRKFLTHYYGTGAICDLTGKRRFTEVKLKCKENPKQPHAMSIYLVEPGVCEYLLVVESQIFCDLVKDGDDETGLLQIP